MIKTIIFQLENIIDAQKILKIENKIKISTVNSSKAIKVEETVETKSLLLDDIAKKYSNTSIQLKRVALDLSSSTSENQVKTPPKKVIVIEEAADKHHSPAKVKDRTPETIKKSIMCIKCSNKFGNFESYNEHLKSCKSQSKANTTYKCFCEKYFKSQNELNIHVSNEHKANVQKHKCFICKKEFTSLFNLQTHADNAHPRKQKITCKTCHTIFKDENDAKLKGHFGKCPGKESEA
jgi:hypothetical protein